MPHLFRKEHTLWIMTEKLVFLVAEKDQQDCSLRIFAHHGKVEDNPASFFWNTIFSFFFVLCLTRGVLSSQELTLTILHDPTRPYPTLPYPTELLPGKKRKQRCFLPYYEQFIGRCTPIAFFSSFVTGEYTSVVSCNHSPRFLDTPPPSTLHRRWRCYARSWRLRRRPDATP